MKIELYGVCMLVRVSIFDINDQKQNIRESEDFSSGI